MDEKNKMVVSWMDKGFGEILGRYLLRTIEKYRVCVCVLYEPLVNQNAEEKWRSRTIISSVELPLEGIVVS